MSLPTIEDVTEMIQNDEMAGWCRDCGDWTHWNCEPDARGYECPDCGKNTVIAAEELLFHMVG